MRKLNNNGFTLLEVVIAMFTLSVVIFIGYGIINGSNEDIKNQQITSGGQLDINIINKYLTKDLENSFEYKDKIDIYNDDNNYEYKYNIKTISHNENNKYTKNIEYKVSIQGDLIDNGEKFKGKYNINRTSKKVEGNNETLLDTIDLVKNCPIEYGSKSTLNIKDILPFKIVSNMDNLYDIEFDYMDKKLKQYKFSVSSRLLKSNIDEVEGGNTDLTQEPPPVDEIPDDVNKKFKEVYGYVGFWAADSRIETSDGNNLSVWSSFKNSYSIRDYLNKSGKHECNDLKNHSISAQIITGNAGNLDKAAIENTTLPNYRTNNNNDANKIVVYVSNGTKLENFKMNRYVPINIEAIEDDGKPKILEINNEIDISRILELSGTMKIGKSNGYVLIVYGI